MELSIVSQKHTSYIMLTNEHGIEEEYEKQEYEVMSCRYVYKAKSEKAKYQYAILAENDEIYLSSKEDEDQVLVKKDKAKCNECEAMAVWSYCCSSATYCDEHVSRGCSCNHGEEITDDNRAEYSTPEYKIKRRECANPDDMREYAVSIDDKGREWPCVEYDYEEKGFIDWEYEDENY